MKRITAILMALAALLVLAACSENESGSTDPAPVQPDSAQPAVTQAPAKPADGAEYIGEWYDYISGRAYMDIKQKDDSTYDVVIHWGSSAWESVEWIMTASYDPASASLVYTDGSERIVTYTDENTDPGIQVLYTDSIGKFTLSTDRITWTDDHDPEASDERLFLRSDRIGEDGSLTLPDDLQFIGFYANDDQSSLDIYYRSDGSFTVDLSITRLAAFEGGRGVYDPTWDTLLVTAEDPNGSPIEYTVSKADNGGMRVDITNSVWDLLPTGESFMFE